MRQHKEKTSTICFRLPDAYIAHLKKISHVQSLEQKKEIKYTDLIRNSVQRCFPMEENR